MKREPDYLDHLIQDSIDNDPGFSEVWSPYAHMIGLSDERIRLGLSQKEVADRMGVNRTAVSRMESSPGKVAFERILRYAHAIGAEFVLKRGEAKSPREKKASVGPKIAA